MLSRVIGVRLGSVKLETGGSTFNEPTQGPVTPLDLGGTIGVLPVVSAATEVSSILTVVDALIPEPDKAMLQVSSPSLVDRSFAIVTSKTAEPSAPTVNLPVPSLAVAGTVV